MRLAPEKAAFVEHVPPFRAPEIATDSSDALSSILRYWNPSVSVADVQAWYGEHPFHLDRDAQPVRCASEHDVWAYRSRGSLKELKARLRAGIPVLVRLQEKPPNPETRFYAVVVAYSDTRESLLAYTGEKQPVALSYDRFLREWRAQDHWMVAACTPDYPKQELSGPEYLSRGQFYEVRRDYPRAAADYRDALRSIPRDDALYVRLGNVYRLQGLTKEAEAVYRGALEIDSHNARACNNLAYLLAEGSKSLDEAVALARRALLLAPANPLVIDTLGFALYQQGKYREAADMLEKARARARWMPSGTQVQIGLHLVWAHHRSGQDHLARQVLRDLLALEPDLEVPPELQPLVKPAGGLTSLP
jgi:tetratricopeptide (TPR) repeat protein